MTEKIWSHRIAQTDPLSADPGELEVLRNRFSNSVVMILPLADGRFAIMGVDRQLHEITTEAPDAETLTRLSIEFDRKLRTRASVVRAESAFYGEPPDGALARDLKRSRSAPPPPCGPQEW